MLDIKRTWNPKTLKVALLMLAENPEAKVMAGGTDVMVAIRHHKIREAQLINLLEIPELSGIALRENGDLWIGPTTSFDEVYRNETANALVPALCAACNTVGSPQIRHIGTIGGNLCNGAVSADTVPTLLAYNAVLEMESAEGKRSVAVTEFHTGPGKTVLAQDEILTGIVITKDNYENHFGQYLKFGQRNSMEISTLGVAAVVKLSEDKKKLEDVRLAYGVAGPRPLRVPKLEAALCGMEISEEMFVKVKTEALLELAPRNSWRASREFREQLIRVQSVRALKAAIEKAGGPVFD